MTIDARRQDSANSLIGLLLSGGLDSSILLGCLLTKGWRVRPIYVRCGLCWETDEEQAVRQYLAAVRRLRVDPLLTLELPLADVYGPHWSITGRDVPAFDSPDRAVFLPGRNTMLIMKAAIWCQMHQISDLALATLNSNPFADATSQFFQELESVLQTGLSAALTIRRPFEQFDKRQVMNLGRDLPLELTFSCISPVRSQHCGRCNKCTERQRAFQLINRRDRTVYLYRQMSSP